MEMGSLASNERAISVVEPAGIECWLDRRVQARRKFISNTVIYNLCENEW